MPCNVVVITFSRFYSSVFCTIWFSLKSRVKCLSDETKTVDRTHKNNGIVTYNISRSKMAALSLRGVLLKPSPALVTVIPSSGYASEVRPRDLNTAAMKRGRGGRSSFSGDVVTLFGANGFIGTAVANRSIVWN